MDIREKINSLEVSEGWKKKFLNILEAEPIKLSGLFPKFKNNSKLKIFTRINFWALFFGIFYYIAKGMWKKGLTILAIGIILIIITSFVNPHVADVIGYATAGLYASMANYDYYRFKVLNENFWW